MYLNVIEHNFGNMTDVSVPSLHGIFKKYIVYPAFRRGRGNYICNGKEITKITFIVHVFGDSMPTDSVRRGALGTVTCKRYTSTFYTNTFYTTTFYTNTFYTNTFYTNTFYTNTFLYKHFLYKFTTLFTTLHSFTSLFIFY